MEQWYVVQTKARRERFAYDRLDAAGLEVLLPQIAVNRHGSVVSREPLFPGYLFARLDPGSGHIHMVSYSAGVSRVVGFGGEPTPVPEELVAAIKERSRAETEGRSPAFRAGDSVLSAHGPLKDVEAIFDRRLSATGRALVLIQIVERVCRTEVHLSHLRPTNLSRF